MIPAAHRTSRQTAWMRRGALLLAAAAVLAALAGCGDDDGGTAAEGGGGGGDKEAFCRMASSEGLDSFENLEDFDPTESDDMEELDRALTELTAVAPREIRGDVQVVADGLRELLEVLSGIDTSDPEALAELSERAEELEGLQERMEASSERVDRYLEEECGIETDP
jgi:hypothetical protein